MTPEQRHNAASVLTAYNAMETTKRRHITLLEAGTTREKKFGLSPSQLERELLQTLLADHDAEVKGFQRAVAALKAQDREALAAVFAHFAKIDRGLEPFL